MAALCLVAASLGFTRDIKIADFQGTDPTITHTFASMNDPVMGGQSYSKVVVRNGLLNFTGACKIVPSLQAPGFITAVTTDHTSFADVSSCKGIKINAKAATGYQGFRFSFGHTHPAGGKFFAYGYKAHFAPSIGTFGPTIVPFHNFTDFWDDATGEPIHTCDDHPRYCPNMATLQDMGVMQIWAEGVEGDVSLLVESISGYDCA